MVIGEVSNTASGFPRSNTTDNAHRTSIKLLMKIRLRRFGRAELKDN